MTPTDGSIPLRNSWSDSGTEEAPPLPPRSHSNLLLFFGDYMWNKMFYLLAPDKRLSNSEVPPCVPKRTQKKSTPSMCSMDFTPEDMQENAFVQAAATTTEDNSDLRDSGTLQFRQSPLTLTNYKLGISMTEVNTNLNNFNNSCYEEFELRGHQEMNINSSPSEALQESPPPIPPKCAQLAHTDDATNSLERRHLSPPEAYAHPPNLLVRNDVGQDAVDEWGF